MKQKSISVIVMAALLLVFAPSHSLQAQSSNTQLSDLIAQLQKSPNDITLRKKIIQTVLAMPAAPEIPDEAL